jgi:hypothetical protein
MNPFVMVCPNEDNSVITLSKNNPEYGYIRVTQERLLINKKGWVSIRPLSALVQADVDTLKMLNWEANKQLKGQIVIKESFEAFTPDNPDKDLKIAGETGIPCCVDGQPIYRKCFYDPTGNDVDDLIQHNNTEEIKIAVRSLKMVAADNFAV